MCEIDAQARGDGNAFSVGSNWCSSSGRQRRKATTSGRRSPAPMAQRDQSSMSGSNTTMDKAVRQRAGHAGGDGAVALAIAGGEYGPAVWQAVFAQGAIEHQLIAGGLDQRRRGVQFVEEQDAGAVLGQERRDGPGRPALLDRWQPTQIDRIKQNGADIDQADAQRRRDLRDDLGFADARRSPEEGRLVDLRQQLQRGCDFRRLHGR